MDYEKKYNEALKRAKEIKSKILSSHLSTESCKAVSEYINEIIPELRESEDERIRKWLYDYISNCPNENFDFYGGVGKGRVLAYLEKQKENPKSADSIPSDCVSDAKCENRWHKVGDSLPDNPREVLCKDEAGNYFIGRYYVGEGWDISNYDDEDKPHHLNPPVSKWIDFPSEKQREQSLRDFIDDFPYSCEQEEQKPKKRPKFKIGDVVKFKGFGDEPADDTPLKIVGYDNELYLFDNGTTDLFSEQNLYELVEQKPAWSEEDEQLLGFIYDLLADSLWNSKYAMSRDECLDRLTSLRQRLQPRPSWRPSEEQMKTLLNVEGDLRAFQYDDKAKVIAELYEQLKRL